MFSLKNLDDNLIKFICIDSYQYMAPGINKLTSYFNKSLELKTNF